MNLHAFMLETEDGKTNAIPEDDEDDGACDFHSETAIVHSYTSEKEMLQGFQRYICRSNPDIITGYNIMGLISHMYQIVTIIFVLVPSIFLTHRIQAMGLIGHGVAKTGQMLFAFAKVQKD